jgi:proline iminopeptidase
VGGASGQPARTTYLPLDGSRLFVRDVGSGVPIVVLHGGPDFDHEYLAPELERLGDTFHVVFYDQRGRGRSFSGEGADDVTIASEVEDLDRVRAWIGAPSVVVLGHSWGGLLALEYAIRHPDRVSHLVLMNSAPASHHGMLELRRELAIRRGPEGSKRMTELASDPTYQSGDIDAEAEYYRIHFGTTVPRAEDLDEVIRRLRIGFTPAGIVAARAIEEALYADSWSAGDYDLLPALRELRIPTLIIRGEHDFIPGAAVRAIAEALPMSQFMDVAGSGHFTYLERPNLVRSAIVEFLGP